MGDSSVFLGHYWSGPLSTIFSISRLCLALASFIRSTLFLSFVPLYPARSAACRGFVLPRNSLLL